MQRVRRPGAVATLPAPPASSVTPGYFAAPDPQHGVPATTPGYEWFNAVQEAIMAVVEGEGLVASDTDNSQLYAAIKSIVSRSSPVVGNVRNLKMSVSAASATAVITADELMVSVSLGGAAYKLGPFTRTINLTVAGAGGMDTGSPPASGYVAIYAIYNPSTGATALLATNATSVKSSEIYSGTGMPAGYTASALLTVWRTNSSSQLIVGYQRDRRVSFPSVQVLAYGAQAAYASVSISGVVPKNAVSCRASMQTVVNSGYGVGFVYLASDSAGTGQIGVAGYASAGGSAFSGGDIDIQTPQTLYFQSGNSAAGYVNYAWISGYEF